MCFNVENITCAAVVRNRDGYQVPDLCVVRIPWKQLKINVTLFQRYWSKGVQVVCVFHVSFTNVLESSLGGSCAAHGSTSSFCSGAGLPRAQLLPVCLPPCYRSEQQLLCKKKKITARGNAYRNGVSQREPLKWNFGCVSRSLAGLYVFFSIIFFSL